MSLRQGRLVHLWEMFEQEEPDISTERLMAMVCAAAHAKPNEVAEALEAEAIEKQTVKEPGV